MTGEGMTRKKKRALGMTGWEGLAEAAWRFGGLISHDHHHLDGGTSQRPRPGRCLTVTNPRISLYLTLFVGLASVRSENSWQQDRVPANMEGEWEIRAWVRFDG
jgi:hypothetical protein